MGLAAPIFALTAGAGLAAVAMSSGGGRSYRSSNTNTNTTTTSEKLMGEQAALQQSNASDAKEQQIRSEVIANNKAPSQYIDNPRKYLASLAAAASAMNAPQQQPPQQ